MALSRFGIDTIVDIKNNRDEHNKFTVETDKYEKIFDCFHFWKRCSFEPMKVPV